jgi:hypothetical protein
MTLNLLVAILYIILGSVGVIVSLQHYLSPKGRQVDIYIFSFIFFMFCEFVFVLFTELKIFDLSQCSYVMEMGVYWNITNVSVRLWQTKSRSRTHYSYRIAPVVLNIIVPIAFVLPFLIQFDRLGVYVYAVNALLAIISGIFLAFSGIDYIALVCLLTFTTELSHSINEAFYRYESFFLLLLESVTGLFATFCFLIILKKYYGTKRGKDEFV